MQNGELAEVLRAADGAYFDAPKGMDHGEWLAAAVRAYANGEDVVERVARTLCAASVSGGHPDDITLMEKPLWTEWEHDSRAAINAMLGGGDE